jgi:trehalose 6-phosphate synthase/phosphatase
MKGKLIFVSNRLPVTTEKKKGGISFKQSVGGLATGLSSFHQSGESLWIGWGGEARESLSLEEYENIKTVLSQNYDSYPVSLTKNDIKQFYHGFCNKTIWPLFHYFPNHTVFDPLLWEAYKRVNNKFCDAVVENAGSVETIWIHDYQLLLLPNLVREKLPKAKIGFFLHIPFPSFEIFRLLPWRKEILEGLLGADLVGFHTYDYVRHFLSSVRRLLGYEHTLGQVQTFRSLVKTDVFPMGIDYEKYSHAIRDPKVRREIERVRKKLGGHKVIISIDRLDYTKGILQRLEAFDHFLRANPDCQGNVTFVLVAVPSRIGVETYKRLKKELDEQVGKLNGKYGNIGWIPVWYLYRSLPFHTLAALYHLADAALVTPLRDGMNLIAKEYIAA